MFTNARPAEWFRLLANLELEGFGELTEKELHLAQPCPPESYCAICYPDAAHWGEDDKRELGEPREPVMNEQTGYWETQS